MNSEKFLTRRIFAGFIDYTIILSISFIYISIFGKMNDDGEYSVTGIKTLPILVFWFIYLCLIETFLNATLGNYIVKLKPVDLNTGKEINLKQSFLRHCVDIIDMFAFGIVAIIIIKNSEKSQRLGDLLAKTKVVKVQ